MLLLRAREKMMERFRPLITAHRLTEQQWRVIRALYEQGPMEPRQISDLCTILSPSMAGVLARMALSLITKERFEEDQRRLLVSLTSASFDLVETLASALGHVCTPLEEKLGINTIARAYQAADDLPAGLERT